MIKNAKFTIVFLFLLAGFSNQNFSNLCAKPIACIITGEQSGEDLAAWFLEKTNLHESHVVNALASTKLCTKFSLHNLNQFESLKRINILNGIENLCKELITQQSTFSACCKYILELKPDKLILVDLPWVNLRLARTIKKASPSTHITFIAPPELWFWGCWHIDTILKTYCDECIVLYPHEQRWYAEKGIQTTWLGYPYEKEFKSFIEEDALPTNRLALLPGSREAEVTKSLPLMCEAVKLSKNVDNFEIIIVQPPSIPLQLLTSIIHRYELGNKITIIPHANRSQLSTCFYALTKPGTITLQLALLGVPHAVIFKTSWLNQLILKYIVQPKALGLPNLLSQTPVGDEFIQEAANPTLLAQHLDDVFDAFKKNESCYKLRRHRIDVFRKAFLHRDEESI